MSSAELIEELDRACRGEKGHVVGAILFGIRYAKLLKKQNVNEIVEGAGLPPSYATEVRKGMRLAPFVLAKESAEEPEHGAYRYTGSAEHGEAGTGSRNAPQRSFGAFLRSFPGGVEETASAFRLRDYDL